MLLSGVPSLSWRQGETANAREVARLTKLLMGKKSTFSTDMPSRGFTDKKGEPRKEKEKNGGDGERAKVGEIEQAKKSNFLVFGQRR